jgi:hypothetical protein
LELIDGGAWYQDQLRKTSIIPAQTKTKNRTNPYVLTMVRNKSLTPSPLERYVICGRPLTAFSRCFMINLSENQSTRNAAKERKEKSQEIFNYAHTTIHFKVSFSTARKEK